MLPTVILGEIDFVLDLQSELREGEEGEEGRHDHGYIKVWVVAEVERRELEGKQAFDEQPRQVDALDAEEAAGQHDDEEGEDHRGDAPNLLVELLQEKLVGTDENTLQGTIDDKVPRCAVPQAANEEAEP